MCKRVVLLLASLSVPSFTHTKLQTRPLITVTPPGVGLFMLRSEFTNASCVALIHLHVSMSRVLHINFAQGLATPLLHACLYMYRLCTNFYMCVCLPCGAMVVYPAWGTLQGLHSVRPSPRALTLNRCSVCVSRWSTRNSQSRPM